MKTPSLDDLTQTLAQAGSAHHDFEQNVLAGVRDELWHGFYAAFVLGRLGDFATPSALSQWLIQAPTIDSWSADAARYVLAQIEL